MSQQIAANPAVVSIPKAEKTDRTAAYTTVCNVVTGFFAGIALVNFAAAVNAIGGVNHSIVIVQNSPMFSEMPPGFYYYLGVQALKLFSHLAIATSGFVGIIAAQLFRMWR